MMPTIYGIPSDDYKGYYVHHTSQYGIPPYRRSAQLSVVNTVPIHEWSPYELPTNMLEWPSMLLLMPTSIEAQIPILQTPQGTHIV